MTRSGRRTGRSLNRNMPDFAQATPGKHKPVLVQESLKVLDLKGGETFIDATFGGGGHTREVIRRYGDKVKVITIDRDPATGAEIIGNFRDMDKLLKDVRPDAMLFDLGISSDQLDASGRGFSFLRDEPLDMRMGEKGITAAEILNSFDESAIELIIRGFGEERFSKRISSEIVMRRKKKPFRTTFDLVQAIEKVVRRSGKIHPATKTFQALRIAVNDELTALEEGLEKGFELLNPGGRLAVITFHSLEDRIVKNFFRDKAKEDKGIIITKKPVPPTDEEIENNPRSRSAKLRAIKKNE